MWGRNRSVAYLWGYFYEFEGKSQSTLKPQSEIWRVQNQKRRGDPITSTEWIAIKREKALNLT